MKYDHALPTHDGDLRYLTQGYQRLGEAVLFHAMNDARAGREDARHFLRGGKMLPHWCELAGVSPTRVEEAARETWPDDTRERLNAAAV